MVAVGWKKNKDISRRLHQSPAQLAQGLKSIAVD